jgi:predicted transcriptional regulator
MCVMSVQTSVKLPDELRARLDRAAALMARDRSAIIVEALDQYLASVLSPEDIARQCHAANAADATDDWEAFIEWPSD